jgi:hypothetical protein
LAEAKLRLSNFAQIGRRDHATVSNGKSWKWEMTDARRQKRARYDLEMARRQDA